MNRVLHIITTLDPKVGGPSHVTVTGALAEQADPQTQVTIVSTRAARADGHTAPALSRAGIVHHEFPCMRIGGAAAERWGLSPRFASWIVRRARDFDVIHVHYVWSVGTVVGALAGRVWRRPVVMTPHESLTEFDIVTSRSRARAVQKRLLRRFLLRAVDRVVLASELERDWSGVDVRRSTVVPHPVVEAPAAVDRRDGQGRRAGELVIGFLGRLHPKKRLDLLLEAFAALPAPARLLVGGDQPASEFARLRRRVEETGLQDRIELAGFVRASAREAFFARIDVLVMPSAYESFGLVAAEAMTAGVPVVVSERTGVARTVARYRAGVVVPVDDRDALVAALATFIASPQDAARMAANAKLAAQETFSFDAYREAMTTLYKPLRT
jgi:glycosyltransferase involved in cell wall biosynthesis